jgi:hypothetical protein
VFVTDTPPLTAAHFGPGACSGRAIVSVGCGSRSFADPDDACGTTVVPAVDAAPEAAAGASSAAVVVPPLPPPPPHPLTKAPMAIAIVEARKVAFQFKVMSFTQVGLAAAPSTWPADPGDMCCVALSIDIPG